MINPDELAPTRLNALTASDVARRLEAGETSSERLVRDCLDRIEARDGSVRAWEFIDPGHAIAQARALDSMPRRSPLHGVPIAIKDIFDTFDMPTAHGFVPFRGRPSKQDTFCVAALRAAGMVILGKTVTTEFASPVPKDTRNPLNFSRSPGVSSSGSAAAVADFMAPLSLGSQTGGSVIVPAAFCGVYGYKASPGAIDRAGYRHCKPTFDSIGFFARSIDDLILLRSVQTGTDCGAFAGVQRPPSVAFVEPPNLIPLDDRMRAALGEVALALKGAGALVADVRLPDSFKDLDACFRVINSWETSIVLEEEVRGHGQQFNDFNRSKFEFIGSLAIDDYRQAIEQLREAQFDLHRIMSPYDALITPSAPGEALPLSAEVVPDECAKLWSLMQLPAVNLPFSVGATGMPLGVQVVGKQNNDHGALQIARWIDRQVGSSLGAH